MTYFDSLDASARSVKIHKEQSKEDIKLDIEEQIMSSTQPNFVLVKTSGSVAGTAVFSDLMKASSQEKMIEVIVSSWDSFREFILSSRFFLICVLSFVNQIINSVAYQSYLVVVSGYEKVQSLPEKYEKAKLKFANIVDIISDEQHRQLWWLETKLDFRRMVKKATNILSVAISLTKKLYLTVVVLACFAFLAYSSVFSTPRNNSLAQQTMSSEIVEDSSEVVTAEASTITNVAQADLDLENAPKVPTVVEHTVEEGDTIETVATLYGLRADTVEFNNNIEEGKLEAGKKIYLPWADGYIYHAASTITVEDLAEIYHVDKDLLAEENKEVLGQQPDFSKGTLVLIPLDDYEIVAKYNKEEEDRIKKLKAEEDRKRLLVQRAWAASRSCSYPESDKIRGFIWPTSGKITQCYHSGHQAFDISDHSLPLVSSVKPGTVVEALGSGYNSGYGNKVVVDHGDGYTTLYAHLSEVHVKVGDKVRQGQAVGRMGNTGRSTGPHLHFEIRYNGVLQNPFVYMP